MFKYKKIAHRGRSVFRGKRRGGNAIINSVMSRITPAWARNIGRVKRGLRLAAQMNKRRRGHVVYRGKRRQRARGVNRGGSGLPAGLRQLYRKTTKCF